MHAVTNCTESGGSRWREGGGDGGATGSIIIKKLELVPAGISKCLYLVDFHTSLRQGPLQREGGVHSCNDGVYYNKQAHFVYVR